MLPLISSFVPKLDIQCVFSFRCEIALARVSKFLRCEIAFSTVPESDDSLTVEI